eukprot:symbB.v1.2.036573.t1/scaffold5196.1/size29908/2
MHHINFRKAGDGTGRDMYIVKEQVALRGKENYLAMKGTLPFKHLDFRLHSKEDSPMPGPKTQRVKGLHRRGKAGPPLHVPDYRRVMESKERCPPGAHWAGGAVLMGTAVLPQVDSSRAIHGFVFEINQALDRLR